MERGQYAQKVDGAVSAVGGPRLFRRRCAWAVSDPHRDYCAGRALTQVHCSSSEGGGGSPHSATQHGPAAALTGFRAPISAPDVSSRPG